MEDALPAFHTFKDIFFLGRAGKRAKTKANALRMDLVKKRKVDEETNAETWTLARKPPEIHTWQDYLSVMALSSMRG
jgi:hypothetical protein